MMTHQTRSGFGQSIAGGRDGLLRFALKLDAVATAATGILSLAASPVLDELLGTPLALLLPVGLFLLAYAGSVWIIGTRPRIDRTAAWGVVAANLPWVLASVAAVATGWLPLIGLGTAFVLVQVAAVALFADLQFLGLRRARPATGPGGAA